jgi:hypothetical protein
MMTHNEQTQTNKQTNKQRASKLEARKQTNKQRARKQQHSTYLHSVIDVAEFAKEHVGPIAFGHVREPELVEGVVGVHTHDQRTRRGHTVHRF